MKISRGAFEKAVAKNLAVGKRVSSAEVRKTLQKIGIDPRFKGQVRESQLKMAFQVLKEKGLLKQQAQTAGEVSFRTSVKKEAQHEAHPGISKERAQALAKGRLREQMAEEEAKKQRITEALGGAKQKAPGAAAPVRTERGAAMPSMARTSLPGKPGQQREQVIGAVTGALPPEPAPPGQKPSARPEPIAPKKPELAPEPPDMFGPSD
jgi:transcriptional regulator with GAF, ATPase, and Fis domain